MFKSCDHMVTVSAEGAMVAIVHYDDVSARAGWTANLGKPGD